MLHEVEMLLEVQQAKLLAYFVQPVAHPMKNIVSREFKGMDGVELAMTKPKGSSSCLVPIKSFNSQLATYTPCSHFIFCYAFSRSKELVKNEVESWADSNGVNPIDQECYVSGELLKQESRGEMGCMISPYSST